jgi:3-dehydroquinate dehydratase/shikimate dehydrogenase
VICATVLEATTSALLARMAEASPRADLLEVRADAVPPGELDLAAVLGRRARPVLFTCRAAREGGLWKGSEEARLALLREAHERGVEWVDVEWDAELDLPPERVVVSRHDLAGALPHAELLGSVRHRKAAVQKVAAPVSDARHALELLALAAREERPTIAIAMGFPGVATRLLAERAGAPWTYAAAGEPAAPGQLPLGRMTQLLGGRRVTRATRALGVIGQPVSHSRSPALMNAVFQALRVDAVYAPLETAEPASILALARQDRGWLGFSVTIPHKETVLRACDRLSPAARATGAVNTVVLSVGEGDPAPREWVGHNTDAPAVALVLARATPLAGARVALLGAGGAARAAAWALREAGARVTLHDRTEERGRRVASELGVAWGGKLDAARADGEPRILVNATSVGMAPDDQVSPVGPDAFDARTVALDMVYVPEETRFLRHAKERGALGVGGIDMFVAQARLQLELWLGRHVAQRVSDEWLLMRARGAPRAA